MTVPELPCVREALIVKVSSLLWLTSGLEESACRRLAERIVDAMAEIPADQLACALAKVDEPAPLAAAA